MGQGFHQIGQWLNYPRLVVGMHDRDQHGVGPQEPDDFFGLHPSLLGGGNQIHLETILGQMFDRFQHRLVLDPGTDDVGLAVLAAPLSQAENRQVVALRGPACEDHFLRFGIHQRGDLLTGFLDGLPGPGPEIMGPAPLVAVLLLKVPAHHLGHRRFHRRGRIAVQIHRLRRHKQVSMPKKTLSFKPCRLRVDPENLA